MQHSEKSTVIASGFAMFSMFFGAGNVIYPLAVGQIAQDQNFYGIAGLLITAVLVPFIGLIASILFDGNYENFFYRIGKVPGFIVAFLIMGLIGPFGATPRTVVIAHSTIAHYLPFDVSLVVFSAIATMIIFLFTFKRSSIMDLIGYYLTPFLLISLGIIVVMGLFFSPAAPQSSAAPVDVFMEGLKEGYNTMDLLATFFFATVVLVGLKSDMGLSETTCNKKIIRMALKASALGAFLLAAVYVGFGYLASFNSAQLADVSQQYLIASVADIVIGPNAGFVVSAAVALACLTTAIALCSVFAEFIHHDLTNYRVGYIPALLITLAINFAVSTLDFKGIMLMLIPALQLCYPALIMLCILNIMHKMWDFKPVKFPVYAVFLVTLIWKFW